MFSPDRLRGHRHGRGLSLAEVATASGLTEAVVRRCEEGDAAPDAETAAALARALGVPAAELAGGGDPLEEYVAAAASHLPPLTEDDVRSAGAVLRTIRRASASAAA